MMSWKVSSGQRGGIVYERLRNESGPHVAGGTWGEGGQPAAAPRHFFMVTQGGHAGQWSKRQGQASRLSETNERVA
jgi:hypothetical protein